MKSKKRSVNRSSCDDDNDDEELINIAKRIKQSCPVAAKYNINRNNSLCRISFQTCDLCDQTFQNKLQALVHNASHIIIPLARTSQYDANITDLCSNSSDQPILSEIKVEEEQLLSNFVSDCQVDLGENIQLIGKRKKSILEDFTSDCEIKLEPILLNIQKNDEEDDEEKYIEIESSGSKVNEGNDELCSTENVCRFCQKSFDSLQELVIHNAQHLCITLHKFEFQRQSTYAGMCGACSTHFTSSNNWLVHKSLCHKYKLSDARLCKMCNQQYFNLTKHQNYCYIRHQHQKQVCDDCLNANWYRFSIYHVIGKLQSNYGDFCSVCKCMKMNIRYLQKTVGKKLERAHTNFACYGCTSERYGWRICKEKINLVCNICKSDKYAPLIKTAGITSYQDNEEESKPMIGDKICDNGEVICIECAYAINTYFEVTRVYNILGICTKCYRISKTLLTINEKAKPELPKLKSCKSKKKRSKNSEAVNFLSNILKDFNIADDSESNEQNSIAQYNNTHNSVDGDNMCGVNDDKIAQAALHQKKTKSSNRLQTQLNLKDIIIANSKQMTENYTKTNGDTSQKNLNHYEAQTSKSKTSNVGVYTFKSGPSNIQADSNINSTSTNSNYLNITSNMAEVIDIPAENDEKTSSKELKKDLRFTKNRAQKPITKAKRNIAVLKYTEPEAPSISEDETNSILSKIISNLRTNLSQSTPASNQPNHLDLGSHTTRSEMRKIKSKRKTDYKISEKAALDETIDTNTSIQTRIPSNELDNNKSTDTTISNKKTKRKTGHTYARTKTKVSILRDILTNKTIAPKTLPQSISSDIISSAPCNNNETKNLVCKQDKPRKISAISNIILDPDIPTKDTLSKYTFVPHQKNKTLKPSKEKASKRMESRLSWVKPGLELNLDKSNGNDVKVYTNRKNKTKRSLRSKITYEGSDEKDVEFNAAFKTQAPLIDVVPYSFCGPASNDDEGECVLGF